MRRRQVSRGAACAVVSAALVFVSASTRAQSPPITKNDFALEFYQGPLVAPTRVIGLGGAYTALAEGVESTAANAAGPAVREAYSHEWLDYDVDLDVGFPGFNDYIGTDFNNRGPKGNALTLGRVSNFIYLHAGAQVQLGYFGASVSAELLRYTLSSAAAGRPGLSLQYGRFHALAAYGFKDDQLVLGAGLRAISLQVSQEGGGILNGQTLLTMTGASPEVGALIRPDNERWRIGTTLRFPVSGSGIGSNTTTTDSNGVHSAGAFILPQKVVMPWELDVGFAFQLGPRPLNPPWINPHEHEAPVRKDIDDARAAREAHRQERLRAMPVAERKRWDDFWLLQEHAIREVEKAHLEAESERLLAERKARFENWPRPRILLLGSLLMTGASDSAVALEGFFDQRRELVGRSVSFSPRAGIESEPVINWVVVRVGSYIEPSRFSDGFFRQHFTFGGDVKLAYFSPFHIFGDQIWRISVYSDVAPRYTNWGLAIGGWH